MIYKTKYAIINTFFTFIFRCGKRCFFVSDFELDIDRYMLDCSSRALSPKTLKSYEQSLKMFFQYLNATFGTESVKEVDDTHLKSYIKEVAERGKYKGAEKVIQNVHKRIDYGDKVSNTTIANYTRNIKVFFRYLHQERKIKKYPFEKVKTVKPDRKMKAYLEDNELKQFFRCFDVTRFDQYRDWIIARVIFDTGARIGELLETNPNDFDLRSDAILLRKTKNGKQRFVYFSQKTRRHLKSWLEYRDRYVDADYMFPTRTGGKLAPEGVERSFRLRSRDIGLQVSPHLLRNNFAKRYLLNGGDIATLSRLLGHASIEITAKIYLDFADKEVSRKYQRHSPLNNLNF